MDKMLLKRVDIPNAADIDVALKNGAYGTLKTAFEEGIYNGAAFGGLGFMGKHPAALRPQMFDSIKLPDADLKKAAGEGYTHKGEFVRQQTERLTKEQEAAEHEAEFPVGEQPKTPPEPVEGEPASPRAAFEASPP